MRLTTSLTFWSAAFFSSLGLSPLVACGGTFISSEGGGTGGGSTGGGSTGGASTGGASTGGITGDGGGAGSGGWTGGDGGFAGAGGLSTGGVVGTGGSGTVPPCRNPTPLLGPQGQPTGFVQCDGSAVHRPAPGVCPPSLPREAHCASPYPYDAGTYPGSCTSDADCRDKPNGFCQSPAGGGLPSCFCNYGCTADSECAPGQICLCGDPVGQCVDAACRSDGDCGGTLCLSYVANPGCGGTGFACQTPGDECASDADCVNAAGLSMQCTLLNGQHRCQQPGCAIGRPFLVAGEARLAPVATRRDWASELSPSTEGLEPGARAALAGRWTEIALMEHASIAAFARFALELLSFGAPPSLVVATHEAMADETVHARDAFALASAYAGRPVGPAALDVGAALSSRSPLEIVRTTILEGCIGETVAAVEAAEALAHATDEAVRGALSRVTLDETRHAELAWRFVQWVLEHGAPELRSAVAAELLSIIDAERSLSVEPPRSARDLDSECLRAHGLVQPETRAEIRRRVVLEIVWPCARALVAKSAQAPGPDYAAAPL